MAIADVAEYAHLSEADIEALAAELEAIRRDIEDSRGQRDSAYIRGAIAFQRCLEVAARLIIGASSSKAGWAVGTAALAVAKSIENMELAHNIGHGQAKLPCAFPVDVDVECWVVDFLSELKVSQE